MKKVLFLLVVIMTFFFFLESFAIAKTYVQGYYKEDGTYVEGYYRSKPNSTPNDNYSTKGNTNPHTGEKGSKPRENSDQGYSKKGSSNSYDNKE